MFCRLKQDNYQINVFVRTHLLSYLIIAQSIVYIILCILMVILVTNSVKMSSTDYPNFQHIRAARL